MQRALEDAAAITAQHAERVRDYETKLARMDWHYEYSDDHSVWTAGRRALGEVSALQAQLDPDRTIWNRYCPWAKGNAK